jgi:hypothetical protein
VFNIKNRVFAHLPAKPGGHLVRDRIVYPIIPLNPENGIPAARWRTSSRMHHRIAHIQERKLGTRATFLDGAHEPERFEAVRLLIGNHDAKGSVWQFVHPWQARWTQRWCSKFDSSHIVRDSSRIIRLGGTLVPVLNPVDFALYLW